VAAQWNAAHPEVQIKVETVPAGQSSEEVILAAVASGTTPDIYASVFPGALQDLLDARAVVRLDAFPDFPDVLRARMGAQLPEQYRSPDGHFYQVPWKANPIMMLYNTGLLREAGVTELPTTYAEFLAAAARVTRDRDGDGQVDQWMATVDYLPIWYKRLFDFYPLYAAATNGQPLVKDGRVLFDDERAVAAVGFLRECFARGYVPRQFFQGDVFLDGRVACRFTGPYSISHIERYGGADFEYAFGPMLRPDGMSGDAPSYADPKSIVIFSNCRRPRAAWEFVKFVIAREGDLRLLEQTSQLPLRAGLLEDTLFADYFARNPRMRQFAAQVESARSIESFAALKEVFDIIAQEVEAAAVFDLKTPAQAVHDAARHSQQVLDAE
jgi:multiple sugar transport system substrate-binding protein